MTSHHFDVIVVGAGPAGMAAAIAASQGGARVGVIDDNRASGGQIWRRGLSDNSVSTEPKQRACTRMFEACGAQLFAGHRVVAAHNRETLDTWQDGAETIEHFRYGKLILATGGRERFLPFPGWTLPGVYGAGGLQALVRGGFSVRGKRVLLAGTGPLLLAVAAHLRQDGAQVIGVCEQATLRQMMPFALGLWSRPAKLLQGAALTWQLRGVPMHYGSWPVAATGDGRVQAVELTDGRRRWSEPCEMLACGFHLVPNTELPALLGCSMRQGGVAVDANQETSIPGVYCVGETTGIAGVDAALVEGRLAGLAAVGSMDAATRLQKRARRERRFAASLNRAFRLRAELKSLCEPDTILCRCEDVRYREIAAMGWHQKAAGKNTWTDAKLQTRCGMGSCQGRICGPIIETLFGERNESVRPPLFPLPMAALACEFSSEQDTKHNQRRIPNELARRNARNDHTLR